MSKTKTLLTLLRLYTTKMNFLIQTKGRKDPETVKVRDKVLKLKRELRTEMNPEDYINLTKK